MTNTVGSSDSDGGGALLYSPRGADLTPSKQERKEATKSDSPTDDEMALVRASSQFNQLTHSTVAAFPNSNDNYPNSGGSHSAGMQLARPTTARPSTAFQKQNGHGNSSRHTQYRSDRSLPAGAVGPPVPPAALSNHVGF
jgi:hypothetical protein